MNIGIGLLHEKMIGDYQVGKQIAIVAGVRLHHACLKNGEHVVLKQPQANTLTPAQLSRFSREYELLRLLDITGIVKPQALVGEQTRPVIVLEYFDGESLDTFLDRTRLDVKACLRLGGELARTLASLHAAGIIHRDIRPANLWLTLHLQHLLLLDLSLASDMQDAISRDNDVLGDWAYVSPEQTGRMNRPVDYRTDMYSLGVTLYRMLTGQLPFAAEDPLEWVHCHVARLPRPPPELIRDIPLVVSDIVMKLLAKLPEDRYQSMHGVQCDLDRCLAQWQPDSEVLPFVLGSEDFSGQFYIPRKLYGREQEAVLLHAAFTQVTETGQPILVTVSGYAGIGKSALVNELEQPIVRQRGYFITGKFDQYLHDIPYATLRQAFQDLMRQLLSESETRIAQWRQEIRAAVGAHGQLVVDILPQVELLIGTQPPVPELPPGEAQNRFRRVFRQFLAVFAKSTHPLVLFLDDLQWIDAASLQLIESLLTHADTRYLLLIGAYRDNEVNAAHPLLSSIETIRRAYVPVQEIVLAPLQPDTLGRLVADTLEASVKECEPLTRLIFDKTEGNPFFFIQFLTGLHKESLLRYDAISKVWRWELAQIRERSFADNVVDLMLGKLRRLPARTQESMQLAACLGNKFILEHLALISEVDVAEIRQHLSAALADGLVMLTDGNGKFLHDRIQQAAYMLIPEQERAAIHLSIGRLLVQRLCAGDLAEHLFDVVNQFNRGATLLTDRQEKEQVADLNLRAGRKAKASVAHASACVYLAAGMALLEEAGWEKNYQITFDLWFERAHCEFLGGHLEEAMGFVDTLLQQRLPKIDQASVYHLKAWLYVFKSENPQAIDTALAYLRLFGMELSAHPTWEQVYAEYDLLDKNIRERSIENLIDLPLITDPDVEAIIRMLSALLAPAAPGHSTDIRLFHLSSCRLVNLSLRYGVSSEAVAGYAHFSIALACGPFYRWHDAYRFSRLTCALVEKHGFIAKKAMAYYCVGLMAYTTQPLSEALECMRIIFRTAIETDDIFIASIYQVVQLDVMFRTGTPLGDLWRESEKSLAFARQVRFRDNEGMIIVYQRLFAALQGRTVALFSFSDASFDEDAFERQLTCGCMSVLPHAYWSLKMEAGFLAGDYAAALSAAARMEPMPEYLWFAVCHYYSALTIAAAYDIAGPDEWLVWRPRLEARQIHLRKLADVNPSAFGDRNALVVAEIARIEGRDLEAMRLYQQAIALAHDNGFIQNEGIGYECASKFYRSRGFDTIADTYIRLARDCFARWGASGKVAQLEAKYPFLRTEQVTGSAQVVGDNMIQLDVLSVTKASQAISGRIVLTELIDTLLRIVLENAGAQRGSLLLARNEEWMQIADVHVDRQAVQVQLHFDAPAAALLPLPASILNYVRRSREKALFTDASQPQVFSSDHYFGDHHPKSVLCLPIVRQDVLVGMLYLENNLITDAFTPERLAVLELLAAQAAISLENALLYTDLKQENSDRKRTEERLREREGRIRRLVESNMIGIFFWDLRGGISEANDAFLRLIGYSHEDVYTGKVRWDDLTPPEYAAADALAAVQMQQAGVCTQYEKEYLRKDGSRVPVLIGGTFLEGSQEYGVAFVVDVSERRHAEVALRKAHDELEMRVEERTAALHDSNQQLQGEIVERQQAEADLARSNAELEQLAYVASHDLQEPLRMVASYLQLLEQRYKEALDADAHEFIDFAVNGAKRMQSLIDDLLTYSRIGTRGAPLQPVDCAVVVATVLHSLRMAIAEADAQITCSGLPVVMADATQLTQLLQNLLINAIKFRREKPVRIHIAAESDGDFWRFGMQDNGIGIAPEYFERIFVMFQRLHTRRLYAGTGMGLAICKKIVERHGGRIWVESVSGQGSFFYFTLPKGNAR